MTRHLLRLVWKRKRANALLTIEIFFSFLVLFGVATLAASMVLRYRRPLGFEYRDCWMIGVPFQDEKGVDEHRLMIDSMLRELRTMPEVEAASAAATPPLSASGWNGSIELNGRRFETSRNDTTDDFAKVLHVKILEGRWFSAEDDVAAIPPLVVDADLARSIAPHGSQVGQVVNMGKKPRRIVGVIAPFRKDGEFSSDRMNASFTRIQLNGNSDAPHYLIVRMRQGVPADFEQVVMKRLHALAPDHPVRIQHMEAMHDMMLRIYLVPAIAAAVVAAFLVTMVFLGLSGVLWQNVTRRTREIGLRRALGATSLGVNRQILGEVALLSTLAVIIGLILIAQLPIVGAFHFVTPVAYGIGIAASLAAIYLLTLLCGLYPGWLAGRVQPAQALHYE